MSKVRKPDALRMRALYLAMALSLALHALAIFGTPPFDFSRERKESLQPLELELVRLPQPVVRQAPQTPAPRAKPRPRVEKNSPPAAAPPVERDLETVESPPPPDVEVTEAPPPSDAEPVEREVQRETTVAPSLPEYPLRAARLVFDVYYGEARTLVGEIVQTWELEGDRYAITSTAEPVGLASLFRGGYVQRSEGRLGPAGFVPERYSVREGGREEQAVFDWEAGTLRLERRGRRTEVPLQPGTQDPLSAVHQLQFHQPLPPGVIMHIATTRRVEQMLFMNMGADAVEAGEETVVAYHVKRQNLDGEITEVWLDPARHLLPVQVYNLNRNGHALWQVLRAAAVTRLRDAPSP